MLKEEREDLDALVLSIDRGNKRNLESKNKMEQESASLGGKRRNKGFYLMNSSGTQGPQYSSGLIEDTEILRLVQGRKF